MPKYNTQQQQFGYTDVMQKLKNVYGTNDAHTLISEIAKESKYIGEGVSKKVYKIDGIEDYVFAV